MSDKKTKQHLAGLSPSRTRMKWIGLTGNMGCGKSTVLHLIKDQGFDVFDADTLAHEALDPKQSTYSEILKIFSNTICFPDGSINKQKLAEIIFNDSQKLLQLESVIHPYVFKRSLEIKQNLINQKRSIAFFEVPLLFEQNWQSHFDSVIVISCSLQTAIHRLKSRNPTWSESEILKRLNQQLPIEEKEKKAHYIIQNDQSLENLKTEVLALIKTLLGYQAQI